MVKKAMLLAALLLLLSAPNASAAEYTGRFLGSNYYVVVPDTGWNGTFVVLAHGLRDLADYPGEVDDTSPGLEGRALGLAGSGYAVATTSYRANGWAVQEALTDVLAVAAYVETRILPATPVRRLLFGESMGGLTTLLRAERGGYFDGYLAQCAPGAGAPRLWDGMAVNLLAYNVVFDDPLTANVDGIPSFWGTVANGNNTIDFEGDGVSATLAGWLGDPSNYAKFEFARLVAGVPAAPTYYTSGIYTNLSLATEYRGELERRAHGPVVQNLDHTYSLTADQRNHLVSLGLPEVQIDSWLATMNGTRYSARRVPRSYLERYGAPTGLIRRPVLTMHTAVDTLIPASHESKYAETVAAAGRSRLLRQWFTDGEEHCAFTNPQIVAAVDALDDWVATRVPPAGPPATVPGFLPGFVPPPWPQP